MARPLVAATTEELYAALPERWRAEDEPLDWPLLRFLSLIGDQLEEARALAARLDYVSPAEGGAPGDSSDLVDPLLADDEWLDWLGQLVGVRLAGGLSALERREAVLFASSGWRIGTKAAIADAARSALTGTRYVVINDHYGGDPWRVEIRTRTSETPDVALVLATVLAKGAKPAGVELVATSYQATWAQVNAAHPTWADLAGKTWTEILETGA